MQYRTFNQNLFKRLIDTKYPELMAVNVATETIIKLHPLDFLFALSKCGIVKKKEDFHYLYERYIIEIDPATPFMVDVITATI